MKQNEDGTFTLTIQEIGDLQASEYNIGFQSGYAAGYNEGLDQMREVEERLAE